MAEREYEIGYGKPPLGRRFQKGQSGNPGGRAKIISATYHRIAREVDPADDKGRTRAELMALALYREAKKGNVPAIKEFTDRLEGRSHQSVALTIDRAEKVEQAIEQLQAEAREHNDELSRDNALRLLAAYMPEAGELIN
jgi:uncharacterized protein YaaN involved in tellurite resistance